MKTLEIENLTKVYPLFTLDNVSFSVERGRIMGFIGRNGAGKSTTLKCLLGFVHKDGGTVKFFGLILDEPTSGLDPVSREDLLDVFLSLKDDGKTILFSTHVTSDLDKCADDITYIRNGKIFASEPTDTFKEKYKLAFVKKDAFTDDIAACSHGVRRLKDGLSVLISANKAGVLNIETTDASLEDIMVHLEKEKL